MPGYSAMWWAAAAVVALACAAAAADPDQLQDFCVASGSIPVLASTINGLPCKPESEVTSADFKFSAMAKAGDTNTPLGNVVTPGTAAFFPALNTLGLGIGRLDLAWGGINPPHLHQRASELLYVVEGTLEVGFVGGSSGKLFSQTITKGDVFLFPRSTVHYQKNVGVGKAVAIAFLNSQNSGAHNLPSVLKVFPQDILDRAFSNLVTPLTSLIA